MEQTDLLLPHRGLPPAEEECLGSATLLSTSLGSELAASLTAAP